MPEVKTQLIEADELIIQTISGETSGEMLRGATAELAQLCAQYRVRRILLDVYASDAVFTPAEFIVMFEGFIKQFPGIGRVAYVLNPETHDIEKMLVATLAFNAGVSVHFFDQLSLAKDWIRKTS